MRQRRRRRKRRHRGMRADRRRGRTRHIDMSAVGRDGNEPAPVDCYSGDCRRGQEANIQDMNDFGPCNQQQPGLVAGGRGDSTNLGALSEITTTTKQSNARQLSADLLCARKRARHAHSNFTALILLALGYTLLSCCYFGPDPSTTGTSTWWQVNGQLLGRLNRQNESSQPHTQTTIVIRTQQGHQFRGLRWPDEEGENGDVAEFLGVRYASAPVKRLRFMPPTPFTYAKGPLHDFTQPGPICMQRIPLEVSRTQRNLIGEYLGGSQVTNETIDNRLELMRKTLLASTSENDRLVRSKLARFVQSEDCLNLNIYTPTEALDRVRVAPEGAGSAHADERQQSDAGGDRQRSHAHSSAAGTRQQLPVLVLVHGHSFDFGSGSLLEAREFARDNRLIVITLNYRLNILGFPPKFGAASRANLGLLDQVAALHWIRANIRSFGGAPENVTLMGYKRGAIFVHLLMLSPLAKGLFQRAILEDGTALSPVVANNLLAANGNSQQQVALVHLRALAHLCDCPLFVPANNLTAHLNDKSQQAANELGGATANSLVFECLRSKPSELLVQHIPSDLIDLNRLAPMTPGPDHNQVLPVANKWRAPLERLFELLAKEELKRRLELAPANGSDEPPRANQQLDEFKRLFESSGGGGGVGGGQLALKADQVNRLAALLVVKLGEYRGERRLSELITGVLSALYLPSNETLPINAVFAPQLESGTLVGATPTQDQPTQSDQLANAMLQRDSPFGQRDLMVGLSAPLIDFYDQQQDTLTVHSSDRRHRDQVPLERPQAGRLLELGLTEEQAIGQVNLFVRSFYRFHQQEISNSIVNQYLNNNNKSPPVNGGGGGGGDANGESSEEQAKVMARRKQMFLLKSLQELYEDALVQVPMLKTVLIHSLRQLESLADLFVAQQLERMRAIMDEAAAGHAADSLWDGPAALALNQLLDSRQLQDSFYNYVKSFYRAGAAWPLRLQPPVNATTGESQLEDERPRSTFLYQFDSSPSALKTKLSHRLHFVLTQLERHPVARNSAAVQELKAVLMKLIEEINTSQVAADGDFEFNFSCGFVGDDSEPRLLRKLNVWICRKQIGQTLGNFVRIGNTNPTDSRRRENNDKLRVRLERYQSECIQSDQLERGNQDHLVQLTSESAETSSDIQNSSTANYEILVEQRHVPRADSCRNRIQSLAFAFMMEFKFLQELDDRQPRDWLVFNVFGQQLANFHLAASAAPASDQHSEDFSLESFASSPSSQRELFDSKVAFWANFIPALNCSRTQPIGAQSLSLFPQANSTLLNMNLNNNCQQQHVAATKTANSQLQSMLARIRLELAERMRARQRSLLGARNQLAAAGPAGTNSSNQNHHSPRMANMSNGGGGGQQVVGSNQLDEMVADSTHSTTTATNSHNNNKNWLTAVYGSGSGGDSSGTPSPVSLAKRAFAFISRQSASVAFWLLSAVFLLAILIVLVSGLAVARQWKSVRARLRKRRANKRRTGGSGADSGSGSGNSEHSPASLQLDASFLQEHENQTRKPEQQQQQHLDQDNQGETNFCRQEVRSLSSGFMTTPPQAQNQILLPPPVLANGIGEADYDGEYQLRSGQHQLRPAGNLATSTREDENQRMQQTGGGGGLLTSSTSSETTNGRAHSSVSLVSTSGTLTGNAQSASANTHGSLASVATIKKRVKISDPKRGRSRSPSAHFGHATPHSMYADSALYCPIHRVSSTNLNVMVTDPQMAKQSGHYLDTNCRDSGSQMTRSMSSYYGQTQEQFDGQYRVCPVHENYDQQQQQQQQQLMLMSQLYLASASKTNSLQRQR